MIKISNREQFILPLIGTELEIDLELTTPAGNNLHAYRVLEKKPVLGERHPFSKLSDSDVLEIRRRRALKEHCSSIALSFGVSHSRVSQIANRKDWKHVA